MIVYAIRFDFPEGAAYAGLTSGAWGFAPTAATAARWTDSATAERVLENAYSPASRVYGSVVEIKVAP